MSEYPDKLGALIEYVQMTDDRAERIQLLIDISKRFDPVAESFATRPFPEENKVPACESEAYAWAEVQPDKTLKFRFAVENPQGISAMAMAVILDETLSGANPEEVARVPGDVIYELFGRELSMGKSMGLMGMVNMVSTYARKYSESLAGSQ